MRRVMQHLSSWSSATQPGDGAAGRPWQRDPRVWMGALLLAVAAALLAAYALNRTETTNNAQVYCDILPVPALVRGQVRTIAFRDNQLMPEDSILAELDPSLYQAQLQQAEAELQAAAMTLAAAQAQAQVAHISARGNTRLVSAALDQGKSGVDTATMNIVQAKAELEAQSATLSAVEQQFKRQSSLFAAGQIAGVQFDNIKAQLDIERAKVRAAQARQDALLAGRNLAQAQFSETARRGSMTTAIEKPEIAGAQAQMQLAQARVDAARAARDIAALNLSYTRIVSKQGGTVSNRRVTVGQTVEVGQPIANIVTCNKAAWVDANFKETQVRAMRIGQPVDVDVDTYPGVRFSGVIEGLSGATGAKFSLLPPENATGNYTKVVQRIPVRIRLVKPPSDRPLMAGMSAVVSTRSGSD
jgi:membrane fusion protein (multidrug efflux system)